MFKGFWETLPKPIIGLSPMDGVTDAAMRFITKKYGHPTVIMTEFVAAEGIRAGATKLLEDFIYDESERPIVAQVFGTEPDAFYQTSIVACALGFDGIDINMGCPAHKVEQRGAGAALIKNPELAQEIVISVKKGIHDWTNGITLEKAGVHSNLINALEKRPVFVRREIPVSIKTRIGYDVSVVEDWAKILSEFEVANITMHGRTLEQLYSGRADWEEIAKAAKIIKQTETLFLGNGDVESLDDAKTKIKLYHLDGVLIGRKAEGNPWVFTDTTPDIKTKLNVALEHVQKYTEVYPNRPYFPIRKHLAWYAFGFPNASDLRQKLVLTNNIDEVRSIIEDTVALL